MFYVLMYLFKCAFLPECRFLFIVGHLNQAHVTLLKKIRLIFRNNFLNRITEISHFSCSFYVLSVKSRSILSSRSLAVGFSLTSTFLSFVLLSFCAAISVLLTCKYSVYVKNTFKFLPYVEKVFPMFCWLVYCAFSVLKFKDFHAVLFANIYLDSFCVLTWDIQYPYKNRNLTCL